MTWNSLYESIKHFIREGLSDSGSISSKRGLLWYVGIVLWTFVHIIVFSRDSMITERNLVIDYDFWIIVSGASLVLGEKFSKPKSS